MSVSGQRCVLSESQSEDLRPCRVSLRVRSALCALRISVRRTQTLPCQFQVSTVCSPSLSQETSDPAVSVSGQRCVLSESQSEELRPYRVSLRVRSALCALRVSVRRTQSLPCQSQVSAVCSPSLSQENSVPDLAKRGRTGRPYPPKHRAYQTVLLAYRL